MARVGVEVLFGINRLLSVIVTLVNAPAHGGLRVGMVPSVTRGA